MIRQLEPHLFSQSPLPLPPHFSQTFHSFVTKQCKQEKPGKPLIFFHGLRPLKDRLLLSFRSAFTAKERRKLVLATNPTKDACFWKRVYVPRPTSQQHWPTKWEKNNSAFQTDHRYHNRFNLCHVFFILFFSSAD